VLTSHLPYATPSTVLPCQIPGFEPRHTPLSIPYDSDLADADSGAFDFKGKYKYDAWKKLEGMSKEVKYVELLIPVSLVHNLAFPYSWTLAYGSRRCLRRAETSLVRSILLSLKVSFGSLFVQNEGVNEGSGWAIRRVWGVLSYMSACI
jgi:hypothetical protein